MRTHSLFSSSPPLSLSLVYLSCACVPCLYPIAPSENSSRLFPLSYSICTGWKNVSAALVALIACLVTNTSISFTRVRLSRYMYINVCSCCAPPKHIQSRLPSCWRRFPHPRCLDGCSCERETERRFRRWPLRRHTAGPLLWKSIRLEESLSAACYRGRALCMHTRSRAVYVIAGGGDAVCECIHHRQPYPLGFCRCGTSSLPPSAFAPQICSAACC